MLNSEPDYNEKDLHSLALLFSYTLLLYYYISKCYNLGKETYLQIVSVVLWQLFYSVTFQTSFLAPHTFSVKS